LAVVARPRADVGGVLGALLDGMDLVVVDAAVAERVAAQPARRLAARARSRGAVLLVRGRWPAADIQLHCAGSRWHGLGQGHGYLRSREVTVAALGRGAAARGVRTTLALWGGAGAGVDVLDGGVSDGGVGVEGAAGAAVG
jgi:hypothetical protein